MWQLYGEDLRLPPLKTRIWNNNLLSRRFVGYSFSQKIFLELLNRLPPGHPKAKITEAASHVREMIQNQIHMEPDQDDLEEDSEDDEEDDEHAMDLDSDMVIMAIRVVEFSRRGYKIRNIFA